ncbi:YfbM family protein [Streptomyces sp. NPDC005963]|uniref:YfbM family protein n=1 Tax=Streptomyces sp. NPDC005963 TaxID=3156721 RepID=UPI0034031D50
MSMNGVYVRLTPSELSRALDDPVWAKEYADELLEAESDLVHLPSTSRTHHTYRAWHALDFLLRRRGFPVDIVHGEEEIPGTEDWGGYGPPRCVTPERVRVAADALAALTCAELIEGVTPGHLAEAGVYPVSPWADEHSLGLVTGIHQPLAAFFRTTALRGHALLTWID